MFCSVFWKVWQFSVLNNFSSCLSLYLIHFDVLYIMFAILVKISWSLIQNPVIRLTHQQKSRKCKWRRHLNPRLKLCRYDDETPRYRRQRPSCGRALGSVRSLTSRSSVVVGVVSAARDGDLVLLLLLRIINSVLVVVLGGHHDAKGWRVRPRSWTMPVSTGSLGEPRAKRCKHCDGNDDWKICAMQKWCLINKKKWRRDNTAGFNVFIFLLCVVFIVLLCAAILLTKL